VSTSDSEIPHELSAEREGDSVFVFAEEALPRSWRSIKRQRKVDSGVDAVLLG
jgi:hypothetical protein